MNTYILSFLKLFLVGSIVLLGQNIAQAQLTGETYKAAKAKGSATITYTYVQTPGFASKSPSGEVTGICVDIMKEFAKYAKDKKNINVSLKFKKLADHDNFKLFMNSIKSSRGGVFGLGNITITEARKGTYNFSPPFISNMTVLLSHNSVPSLKSLDQISTTFAGMKAYSVKGTTNEARILEIKRKYMPNLQVIPLVSSMEVLNKISTDKQAFTNLDFTYYMAVLKQRKPIRRHKAGEQVTEQFGIIMPKSNDWAPLMKEFFESGFIGGVEHRKIIARHLGENTLELLDYMSK